MELQTAEGGERKTVFCTQDRYDQESPGVNEECTRICGLINCSTLAELSFGICPLKVEKKRCGGGVRGVRRFTFSFPTVSLVHMIPSTNSKGA